MDERHEHGDISRFAKTLVCNLGGERMGIISDYKSLVAKLSNEDEKWQQMIYDETGIAMKYVPSRSGGFF